MSTWNGFARIRKSEWMILLKLWQTYGWVLPITWIRECLFAWFPTKQAGLPGDGRMRSILRDRQRISLATWAIFSWYIMPKTFEGKRKEPLGRRKNVSRSNYYVDFDKHRISPAIIPRCCHEQIHVAKSFHEKATGRFATARWWVQRSLHSSAKAGSLVCD